MTDLTELIERVRALTGPDRALSAHVHFAVLGEHEPYHNTLHCTGGSDAALHLAERAFSTESPSMLYAYDLNWHASAHAEMAYVADLRLAVGTPSVMQTFHGQAHTLPIAITLATLLAMQATGAK